jgi:t-SNARE complex subunit (syntaxin)
VTRHPGNNGTADAVDLLRMYLCRIDPAEETVIVEEVDRVRRVYGQLLAERHREREAELRTAVEDYLREHPEATANVVRAAVRGRKQDVLRLVAEARRPVPACGNHHAEEQEH